MQRARVMLAVFLLVATALAVGALASNWPFWARAWQWHTATDGWPRELPGPVRLVRGGAAALPLYLAADPPPADATGSATRVLLRAGADGRGGAFVAPGYAETSLVDGRILATALLAPLYGLLEAQHPGVLDAAIRTTLERWKSDPRGEITPRQLLYQLSGFGAADLQPLNPASAASQLASGPDFNRAALHWKVTWPPGSHFESSPVNAQLLALVAARIAAQPYEQLLERRLWSQLAAADAVAMLDHPRGNMAAHCCLRATAADWLRLGLLLADDGRIGTRQLLPPGFVGQLAVESPVHPGYGLGVRLVDDARQGRLLILEAPGRQLVIAPALRRALFWVGDGAPPPRLHELLDGETAGAAAWPMR